MNSIFLLVALLIPLIGGALIPFLPFKNRKVFMIYTETITILTSVCVFSMIILKTDGIFTLVRFHNNLKIAFRLDGLSMVFGGLIAGLWPFATLYSFEYMEHEHNPIGKKHEYSFFGFYTMTFGVTLGIATAENMLTMYCFYEMLTLVTVPLVMYTMTREAILASRKYLYYSLGGAAFGFMAMVFIIVFGESSFAFGGTLDLTRVGSKTNLLLLIYVLAFFGFGVKAAICPFNSWLPQAGVAPTPVTALLHAVAVVKSGAFAVIRLTYYAFGISFLRGTWAQYVVMAFTMFTIVYGCSRAVKETHFKRRLAYSTISNLSYILFGVTVMTPLGLVGALSHMVFHGVMKICSFFCAGAVICRSGKHYITELDGLGRKMPKVCGIFTLSAFALMGVPGLCGFISKFNLANAAVQSNNTLAYFGIGAILISAILTAIYMMTVVIRMFFPKEGFDYSVWDKVSDPSKKMLIPLFVFCIAIAFFGLYSTPFVDFLTTISKGAI